MIKDTCSHCKKIIMSNENICYVCTGFFHRHAVCEDCKNKITNTEDRKMNVTKKERKEYDYVVTLNEFEATTLRNMIRWHVNSGTQSDDRKTEVYINFRDSLDKVLGKDE